nr:glycosyltransferase family 2 protein [Paracraurococcus ruber]
MHEPRRRSFAAAAWRRCRGAARLARRCTEYPRGLVTGTRNGAAGECEETGRVAAHKACGRDLEGFSRVPSDPLCRLPDGLTLIGPPPRVQPGEVVGVVVARNEELRLGAALRHYRQLGIGPILLLDNGSTDGTRAIAAGVPRVHVVAASGRYADSGFGIAWINAVLDRFARDHWALMFDADELLVFPGADAAGSLPALCAHLDRVGSECLQAFMLDLFPREPLHSVAYRAGQDLLQAAPWFEPPRLRREAIPDFPHVAEYGGIRQRIFFPHTQPDRPLRFLHEKLYNLGFRLAVLRDAAWFGRLAPPFPPNLTKVPLLRWRAGVRFLSAHATTALRRAAQQPTGVLLHFKFLQDFHERAMDAVARNAHYAGSIEYREYLRALTRDPDLTLFGPASQRYGGPEHLTRLGLMADSTGWRAERLAQSSALVD